MILQGSQRGGAKNLAQHLLKHENEHIDIHELRGFVSDDLVSALNEIHAISKGTKAKQPLFSLSLNPPPEENVTIGVFEDAISRVEDKLGLSGQPRAIVFHEKEGRRHAHAVWSRIDADRMKAIRLPFTRYKLRDISRELYLEHGWKMPRGFANSKERDPRNFSMAEWQQAKRAGNDVQEIKAALQDSWAISDTQSTFQQALRERGYTLARGDRRGFVALDHRCEVYAIPKWLGLKAKDVRSRLTDRDALPSVDEARTETAKAMTGRIVQLRKQHEQAVRARHANLELKRRQLRRVQVAERQSLRQAQERRWQQGVKERQARYNKGFRGLIDRFTGQRRRTKMQNERETHLALERDRQEKDGLIFTQLEQRRRLQSRIERLKSFDENRKETLSQDVEQYRKVMKGKRDVAGLARNSLSSSRRSLSRDR